MKQCVLCGESMIPDLPDAIYTRNPATFRFAWMHDYCHSVTLGDLKGKPARKAIYDDRHDEYMSRFEGGSA